MSEANRSLVAGARPRVTVKTALSPSIALANQIVARRLADRAMSVVMTNNFEVARDYIAREVELLLEVASRRRGGSDAR